MSNQYLYQNPEPGYDGYENFNTTLRTIEGTDTTKNRPNKRMPSAKPAGNVNYMKAEKRLRKGQKSNITEGVVPDSQNDVIAEDHILYPDELGMDGQEKHFMQLMYESDSNESNFF